MNNNSIIIPSNVKPLDNEAKKMLANEVIISITLAHLDRFKEAFDPVIVRNTDLSMTVALQDVLQKRKLIHIPPAKAPTFSAYYSDEEPEVVESIIKKHKRRVGRPSAPRKKFYAVAHGRQPGIYACWSGDYGAQRQVSGYSSSTFKSFKDLWEAVHWMRDQGVERPMFIERDSARFLTTH